MQKQQQNSFKQSYFANVVVPLLGFSKECCTIHNIIQYVLLQLISYKRYLECTLVQWRLSIFPLRQQVAEGTFFMKSPVPGYSKYSCSSQAKYQLDYCQFSPYSAWVLKTFMQFSSKISVRLLSVLTL